MHVDLETPQTAVTDNVDDGSHAQKNRQFFHLALLITAVLLITAFWVGNTRTPAHADTQAGNLHPAAPTAPYCPPGSGDPSEGGGDPGSGDDDGWDSDSSEYESVDLEDPSGFPEEAPLGPDGQPSPLSRNERHAIWLYSTTQSTPINGALRSGDPAAIRSQFDAIHTLKSALRKLPDHKGKVYRTTTLTLDLIQSYKKNEIITDKTFLSTTVDPEFGKTGIPELDIGQTRFIIESKTGKDISSYTKSLWEAEVLFPPGTKFRVTRKYRDRNGDWVIEMTEVG